MSDLSGSAPSPLENGPETQYVVAAVEALLRSDIVGARLALIEGAEATHWEAIAHRLDVAGHALAVDAGLEGADRDEIVLLPGLDTSSWTADLGDDAARLIARWSGEWNRDDMPIDYVWPSLAVVAWLVDRAGYPAQVVV